MVNPHMLFCSDPTLDYGDSGPNPEGIPTYKPIFYYTLPPGVRQMDMTGTLVNALSYIIDSLTLYTIAPPVVNRFLRRVGQESNILMK